VTPTEPPALLIDARGHRCPVPTLRLRKALSEHPDAVITLLADDPMAQIDVPHFCQQNGFCLIVSIAEGAHRRFVVSG
jgi:tRNA 2-thiouridine synthesizing protein A